MKLRKNHTIKEIIIPPPPKKKHFNLSREWGIDKFLVLFNGIIDNLNNEQYSKNKKQMLNT